MKREDELAGALGLDEMERRPYTEGEKEEDWLYFHLDCARRARSRLERIEPGTGEWFHEQANRRASVASAMKHYDLLLRMRREIPALLDSMMRAEGI